MKGALIVGLVALACNDAPEPPVAASCSQCTTDPWVHCLRPSACTSSSDCPTGTRCNGSSCEVTDQTIRPQDTLSAGFEVERLRFVERAGENGALPIYEWELRRGARVVVCALFGCLPEIQQQEGVRRIVNYDQCVIAEDVYRIDPDHPAAIPFSAADDTGNAYQPAPDPRCERSPTPFAREVTALAVGCWAYDDTALVAASQLIYTTPASTGDYAGQIPREAACSVDFARCYAPESDTFGYCYSSVCRSRCMVEEDCQPVLTPDTLPDPSAAMDGDAGLAAEPAPQFECRRASPGAVLGVCVPAGGSSP